MNFDELLAQATQRTGISESKRQRLSQVSEEKFKALAGDNPNAVQDSVVANSFDGAGNYSASELENDLRNLQDYDLRDKYGDNAEALIQQKYGAYQDTQGKLALGESGTLATDVGNAGVGVVHGFANLVNGLGFLGAAGIDKLAGTDLAIGTAEYSKDMSKAINKWHSDSNISDTAISNQVSKLNERDTTKRYKEDLANGESKVTALPKKLWQDFKDELSNSGNSGEQLNNLLGEAIGSIGGIGVTTKIATKAGTKALEKSIGIGLLEKEGKAAIALAKYGNAAKVPALIGATEGGSAASEAVNRIMEMSPDILLKDPVHGERFRALAKEIGFNEAKIALAKEVGNEVLIKTAPAAALIGIIAGKFEGNPLGKVSLPVAVGNIARQGGEETLQEGTGQLITNAAIAGNANSAQDIGEGVGSGAAKGALGGVLVAGALQQGSLVNGSVKPIVAVSRILGGSATRAAIGLTESLSTRIEAKLNKNSPIANDKVLGATEEILPTIPDILNLKNDVLNQENATEEEKDAVGYVGNLAEAINFSPPNEGDIASSIVKELQGTTSSVEAIQRLAKLANDSSISPEDKIQAIAAAHGLISGINLALAEDSTVLEKTDKLPELKDYATGYQAVLGSLLQSPAMGDLSKHFDNLVEDGFKYGFLKEIDTATLNTPEGQSNLDKVLRTIGTSNAAVPENVQQQLLNISEMADTGEVTLTPQQGTLLQSINAEFIGAKVYAEEAAKLGLPKVDFVSKQITTNPTEKNPAKQNSAREHSRGIVAAIQANKPKLAKERLEDFGNFVKHLNNKVIALNTYVEENRTSKEGGVKYSAYKRLGQAEWSPSKEGLWVNLTSEKSVALAKTVGLEAASLAAIYNNLVKAFPELKAKKFEVAAIHPKIKTALTEGTTSATDTSITEEETPIKVQEPKKEFSTLKPREAGKEWGKILATNKGIRNLRKNLEEGKIQYTASLKNIMLGLSDKNISVNAKEDFNAIKKLLGITRASSSESVNPVKSETKSTLETNKVIKNWNMLLNKNKGIKGLLDKLETGKLKSSKFLADTINQLPEGTIGDEYIQEFNKIKDIVNSGSKSTNPTPKEETSTKKDEPKTSDKVIDKYLDPTDLELKRGSVVSYNNRLYLLWNITKEGKAQLLNGDGTKYSGTPDLANVRSNGAYKTTTYNGTEYIVTSNAIYSTASGKSVYAGKDASSVKRRNDILNSVNGVTEAPKDTTENSSEEVNQKETTSKEEPDLITTVASNFVKWIKENSPTISAITINLNKKLGKDKEAFDNVVNKAIALLPDALKDNSEYATTVVNALSGLVKKDDTTPVKDKAPSEEASKTESKPNTSKNKDITTPPIKVDPTVSEEEEDAFKGIVKNNKKAASVDIAAMPEFDITNSDFEFEFLDTKFKNVVQAITYIKNKAAEDSSANTEIANKALTTTSFEELKQLSSEYVNVDTKLWNEILPEIIKQATKAYLDQNSKLKKTLTDLGEATLVSSGSKSALHNAYLKALSEAKATYLKIDSLGESTPIIPKGEQITFSEIMSNLVFKNDSRVYEAISYDKTPKSRLVNESSPIAAVVSALGSNEAWDAFTGEELKPTSFVKQARSTYQEFILKYVDALTNALNKSAVDFLNTKVPLGKSLNTTSSARIILNEMAVKPEDRNEIIQKVLKEGDITYKDLPKIKEYLVLSTEIAEVKDSLKSTESVLKSLSNEKDKDIAITQLIKELETEIEQIKSKLNSLNEEENSSPIKDKLNTFSSGLLKVGRDIDLITLAQRRELHRVPNGRLINFLEKTDNGYTLNSQFTESVAIATLNWMLSSKSSPYKNFDVEDVAAIVDLPTSEITSELIKFFNTANSTHEVVESLAKNIKEFLGFSYNKDAFIGDNEGVVLSIAATVLDNLETNNLVEKYSTKVKSEDTDNTKTYNLYKVVDIESPILNQYTDLLEDLVLVDREKPVYIGKDAKVPVANSILRNRNIPLTNAQKELVKTANEVEQYFNMPTYELYNVLGDTGLVELFGVSNVDPDQNNKNYLESIKGKNLSISGAWNAVKSIAAKTEEYALNNNMNFNDVVIKYAKGITSVARLQTIGSYTNQSSKITRPIITPTITTVDLSDSTSREHTLFLLGIAQGMGVKIHNLMPEEAIKKLNTILAKDEVKAAMDALIKFNQDKTSIDIAVLKAALPAIDNTNWGLSSLMEYAIYSTKTKDELKAHKTNVVIEADGTTNGSANALHILVGRFTKRMLRNWRMTGFFVGSKPRTLNEERTSNPMDLYSKIAETTQKSLVENFYKISNNLKDSDKVYLNAMFTLIQLLNIEMSTDADGNIVLKRGSTKNPVTVTLYGSGVGGISDKVTNALLNELYSQMSDALKGKGILTDEATFNKVRKALDIISGNLIVYSAEKQEYFLIKENSSILRNFPESINDKEKLKKFTINPTDFVRFSKNIRSLYVNPMVAAIEEELTTDTSYSYNAIIAVTNIQAAIMRERHIRYIKERIAYHAKHDLSYRKSNYLSKAELDEIEQRVIKELNGIINNGQISFSVSSTEKTSGIFGMPEIAASSINTNKVSPVTGGFSLPGVGAVPKLVIGNGDGYAIQIGKLNINMPKATLDVFDGIEAGISNIDTVGYLANEAVWRTWTENNPLTLLADSFNDWSTRVTKEELSDPNVIKEINRYLNLSEQSLNTEQLVDLFNTSLKTLINTAAAQVEAQQNVVKQLSAHVDQMASAQQVYSHDGIVLDNEETLLEDLQKMYDEEYVKTSEKRNVGLIGAKDIEYNEPQASAEDVKLFSDNLLGYLRKGDPKTKGAFVIKGMSSIKKLIAKVSEGLPINHKLLYRAILSNFADSGYQLIIGERKDVLAKLKESEALNDLYKYIEGKEALKGVHLADTKTIVLIGNQGSEVLFHELIHAAVSSILDKYYRNELTGSAESKKRITHSVKQLETMLNEFLSDNFSDQVTEESLPTYSLIKQKLEKYSLEENGKKKSIDEFLAYVLANEKMFSTLSTVQTKAVKEGKGIKFLKAVKNAILNLFTDSYLKMENTDFFSTMMFHTYALSTENITKNTSDRDIQDMEDDSSTRHKDERLEKLVSLLSSRLKANAKSLSKKDKTVYAGKVVKAKYIAKDVNNAGFTLSAEEQNAFKVISLAMEYGLETNTTALQQLQEIYSNLLNAISVEDFYPNENPSTSEKAIALDKYDALLGKYADGSKVTKDTLSNFIALAITSKEVKGLLNKAVNNKQKSEYTDFVDAKLDSFGNYLIENLTQSLSVSDRNKDVETYFEVLVDALFVNRENNLILNNKVNSLASSQLEAANDWLVNALQTSSKKVGNSARNLATTTNNALVKAASNAVYAASTLVNEDIAGIAAEDINHALNKVEGFQPFRDFMADIIGRTESNKTIYDLIKPVRVFVDKLRQSYKVNVPLIIQNAFTKRLSDSQWQLMTKVIANANFSTISSNIAHQILIGKIDYKDRIAALEDNLSSKDPAYFKEVQAKAKQLAEYNVSGKAGNMLLRNAYTISKLYGLKKSTEASINESYINRVDELVTLYSYDLLSSQEKDAIKDIASQDKEGMILVLSYLKSIRKEDKNKLNINAMARANAYYGYVPTILEDNTSIIVAPDKDYAKLTSMGYTRIAAYEGDSRLPKTTSMSYFKTNIPTLKEYKQGILQTVQSSAFNVDLETGRPTGNLSAGLILDSNTVTRILNSKYQPNSEEELIPIFNETGTVVGFEKTMSSRYVGQLNQNRNLSSLIGLMRGRQVEEQNSKIFAEEIIKKLGAIYQEEPDKTQFIDLFDEKQLSKSGVLRDSINLLNFTTRDLINNQFDGHFYIKREMLTDVLGYRSASITDPFTGVSNFSPETLKNLRNILIAVFGVNIYKMLSQAENVYQEGIAFVKGNIIVKSVVVPVANILGNALHLLSVGVPWNSMVQNIPKKLNELEYYIKTKQKLLEVEVKLQGAKSLDNRIYDRLLAEKKSLEASFEKLSIAPLIKAGELSNINDVGLSTEDAKLLTGNLKDYFETLLDKTPEGVKSVGRHLIVSKDTALYAGMQKSVLYGDFIAKALLYDHLVKTKKQSSQDALVRISSEFINYDKLPGRARNFLENMGLLWFYNFKLRSLKVAVNTIRNNPLHALLANGLIGSSLGIDTPITDNVVAQVVDGTLEYSVGVEMGINGLFANPYSQLLS